MCKQLRDHPLAGSPRPSVGRILVRCTPSHEAHFEHINAYRPCTNARQQTAVPVPHARSALSDSAGAFELAK